MQFFYKHCWSKCLSKTICGYLAFYSYKSHSTKSLNFMKLLPCTVITFILSHVELHCELNDGAIYCMLPLLVRNGIVLFSSYTNVWSSKKSIVHLHLLPSNSRCSSSHREVKTEIAKSNHICSLSEFMQYSWPNNPQPFSTVSFNIL